MSWRVPGGRARSVVMTLVAAAVGVLPAVLSPTAAEAAVNAPTPLAPANGASVLVPFTISWSAVDHPSGIAGYNWRIGTSSTFSTIVQQDSTAGNVTQATVSGLPNGTYFWGVQAASNSFEQSAWSS